MKTMAEIRSQSTDVDGLMLALAKAQGEIGEIERDRTVRVRPRSGAQEYEFKYATLSAIIKGIKKALSDNGIAYTHVMTFEPNERLYYLTTSLHFGNQFISSVVPLIITQEGNQPFGSSLTYMKRYCLAALVGVAADEDDDANAADGNQIQEMKKPPQAAPDQIMEPKKVAVPRQSRAAEPVGPGAVQSATGTAPSKGWDDPKFNPIIRKIDVALQDDGETHDWMGWGKEFIATARAMTSMEELAELEKVNATPLKNMELNAPRMFNNLNVSLIKVRKIFESQKQA
jgi:hypothetical protein